MGERMGAWWRHHVGTWAGRANEESAATASERLASVVAAMRSGANPCEAWTAWSDQPVGANDEVPGEDARLTASLTAGMRLARHSGVPVADIIADIARIERDREAAAMRADVALAGPRASARTLMWLPVGGLAFSAAIDPAVIGVFRTPLGWAIVGFAALLMWAASRWMAALMRDALEAGRAP